MHAQCYQLQSISDVIALIFSIFWCIYSGVCFDHPKYHQQSDTSTLTNLGLNYGFIFLNELKSTPSPDSQVYLSLQRIRVMGMQERSRGDKVILVYNILAMDHSLRINF